jgi:RNA polymerase sigma-70 factor (ECF subfamily)
VTNRGSGGTADSPAEMIAEQEQLLAIALRMSGSATTTSPLHHRTTREFAMACGTGNVDALVGILLPDAVMITDGGGKVRAAPRPVGGAVDVAGLVTTLFARLADADLTVEAVNGAAGIVLRQAHDVVAVFTLAVAGSKVAAVWVTLNPDKLRHWRRGRGVRAAT